MLSGLKDFVWGPVLIILLVSTGIYMTVRLRALQITKLPLAIKYISKRELGAEGDISSFGALCTALAGTVGTGNIIGVATAIKLGGPGALLWLWIAAFFCMATKYAEGLLSVKYRRIDDHNQMSGGPMYYIERGMGIKWKPLANFFAVATVLTATLGTGNFVQVNFITTTLTATFGVSKFVIWLLLVLSISAATLSGIKGIARVTEVVVPFMCVFYFVGAVIILVVHFTVIPSVFKLILESAFNPAAATGGIIGGSIINAIQQGFTNGTISNESGFGTAPIAAAAARSRSCVRQGLVCMTGTFFDSIVVCAITGLAVITTGVWNQDLEAAEMASAAFGKAMPGLGNYIVSLGLFFFAYTTTLGWNYYGERCCEYLFGVKSILIYRLLFIALAGASVYMDFGITLVIANILFALMALPNLIAIISLSNVVVNETKAFFLNELK